MSPLVFGAQTTGEFNEVLRRICAGRPPPNSQLRITITQEKKTKPRTTADKGDKTAKGKRHSMTWAQRLKRVFNIEIETCEYCLGKVKVIACIEVPVVIKKILEHLTSNEEKASVKLPLVRATPVSEFTLVN